MARQSSFKNLVAYETYPDLADSSDEKLLPIANQGRRFKSLHYAASFRGTCTAVIFGGGCSGSFNFNFSSNSF